MKIEVNINKKYAFLIVGLLLLIGAGLFVYAYNSNPSIPAIMGHSPSEIDWSQAIPSSITVNGNVNATGNFNIVGGINSGGDVCANGRCLSKSGGLNPIYIGNASTVTIPSNNYTGILIRAENYFGGPGHKLCYVYISVGGSIVKKVLVGNDGSGQRQSDSISTVVSGGQKVDTAVSVYDEVVWGSGSICEPTFLEIYGY
jgi:hypothetical protein